MKMITQKISLLVVALTAFTITPAFAQKQTPPEGGPPKAFTVPANETYTLPNGLKVTLVPYGIIPKAALSLSVYAGEINEGSARVGVAGLTADLMKEGTDKYTSQQMAEAAARMGSTLDINAGTDQTKLGLDVLEEFTPDAVKLLADAAEHPRLPESEIARLKNDSLRQIALANSQAQTQASGAFPQNPLWGSSLRHRSADRGRDPEADHSGCEGFLQGQFRCAARASLRGGKI